MVARSRVSHCGSRPWSKTRFGKSISMLWLKLDLGKPDLGLPRRQALNANSGESDAKIHLPSNRRCCCCHPCLWSRTRSGPSTRRSARGWVADRARWWSPGWSGRRSSGSPRRSSSTSSSSPVATPGRAAPDGAACHPRRPPSRPARYPLRTLPVVVAAMCWIALGFAAQIQSPVPASSRTRTRPPSSAPAVAVAVAAATGSSTPTPWPAPNPSCLPGRPADLGEIHDRARDRTRRSSAEIGNRRSAVPRRSVRARSEGTSCSVAFWVALSLESCMYVCVYVWEYACSTAFARPRSDEDSQQRSFAPDSSQCAAAAAAAAAVTLSATPRFLNTSPSKPGEPIGRGIGTSDVTRHDARRGTNRRSRTSRTCSREANRLRPCARVRLPSADGGEPTEDSDGSRSACRKSAREREERRRRTEAAGKSERGVR